MRMTKKGGARILGAFPYCTFPVPLILHVLKFADRARERERQSKPRDSEKIKKNLSFIKEPKTKVAKNSADMKRTW